MKGTPQTWRAYRHDLVASLLGILLLSKKLWQGMLLSIPEYTLGSEAAGLVMSLRCPCSFYVLPPHRDPSGMSAHYQSQTGFHYREQRFP